MVGIFKFSYAQVKYYQMARLEFLNSNMLESSIIKLEGWRTRPGELLRRPGLLFGRRPNWQLARASTDNN